MPTMTIKDIPADIYELVKKKAKAERRSMNSQAICALERDVGRRGARVIRAASAEKILGRVRKLRGSLKKMRPLTDEEISRFKNEGRP